MRKERRTKSEEGRGKREERRGLDPGLLPSPHWGIPTPCHVAFLLMCYGIYAGCEDH
ncbi:hypothetical protein O77CONTIG1_03147 [Leptolyngbya sp. O-77]|nr:hypothetical protein O77CONTIG1_03147 [Leptolyngbya sp. O-77]